MLKNKILSVGEEEKLYVDDVFQTWVSTGNGSSRTVTGPDMTRGGLSITKSRSAATGWNFVDTARGAGNSLSSNSTAASVSETTGVTAFTSTGTSIGSAAEYNSSGNTYVDYLIRRAPKFFDVVTYTGDGAAGRQILHNLGIAPGFIAIKRTDSSSEWAIWHRVNGSGASGRNFGFGGFLIRFSENRHTSSTIDLSQVLDYPNTATQNISGASYVAYIFAHDPSAEGFIQCGEYVGDGLAEGYGVYLGWEPQYLMIFNGGLTFGYLCQFIFDTMRGIATGAQDSLLCPDSSDSETYDNYISVNSTGFTPTGNTSAFGVNYANNRYMYIAIRRPNKPPTTGAQVYNAIARTGTGAAATVTGVGFAPDVVTGKRRQFSYPTYIQDKLRGSFYLNLSNTTSEQQSSATITSYGMDGVSVGSNPDYNGTTPLIHYFFKRAPGFFETFAYTGTGISRTTPHGLSTAPDLLIVKSRSATGDWQVWYNGLAASEKLVLNSDAAKVTDSTAWNSTLPTAKNITVGTSANTNANGTTYIAYAFGNLPGIQKIGTYVGDGTSGRVIDCGFTTGARFVCIKAVSTTGSWLVSDSVRGIISAADPYLQLNSTAAEVTTEDWLDPSSTGFIVNNVTSSNANASGVTYMYWAIS